MNNRHSVSYILHTRRGRGPRCLCGIQGMLRWEVTLSAHVVKGRAVATPSAPPPPAAPRRTHRARVSFWGEDCGLLLQRVIALKLYE